MIWWRAYTLGMRIRCCGIFHDFDKQDYGDGMPLAHTWYCMRCYVVARDDEFVNSGTFYRLIWRVGGRRLWYWWHKWAWRFER